MISIAPGAAAASPTRPWPADRVEQWPIERLILCATNARLRLTVGAGGSYALRLISDRLPDAAKISGQRSGQHHALQLGR